jgi:hypothetical protein
MGNSKMSMCERIDMLDKLTILLEALLQRI